MTSKPRYTTSPDLPTRKLYNPATASIKARAYKLFKAGKPPSAVRRLLKISEAHASTLHIAYRKASGCSSVAHIGKVDMIHQLLQGRKNLQIYETCGYAANGRKGACTAAYEHYGDVLSMKTEDGDWKKLAHLMLGTGRQFDVVDCDGFGDPYELLLIGISNLVKPGGLLLTTWPDKITATRFPVTKVRSMVIGGAEPTDRLHFLERAIFAHGSKAAMVSLNHYDKTVRIAHRITSLVWPTKTKRDEPYQLAQTMFGEIS